MKVQESCVYSLSDRAGSGDLVDVFSLGDLCLNSFPHPSERDTEAYPLTLAYAPKSGLVQLRHSVDPELMFRDYWYESGTNESMKEHLCDIVVGTNGIYTTLKSGDTVVDIGCNDGTLLGFYSSNITKVGYDPSTIAPKNCDIFINYFFGPTLGVNSRDSSIGEPGYNLAKIVTSIAMFYDVDDPVRFASNVRQILHEDGVWVLEVHYLPKMLDRNEVDAICHEHLCYYSLTSLMYVLAQAGLSVVDVSFNETNGGSMVAFVKKAGRQTPSPLVQNTLEREKHTPMIDRLVDFGRRVEANKFALQDLLEGMSDTGKQVYGYGASTKGNTLLQYAGIEPDVLPAIADRNPLKWGRETVGTRIPIISEAQMREDKPDYLLALPYHFIDNFKKREPWAKWITPVPTPRILS